MKGQAALELEMWPGDGPANLEPGEMKELEEGNCAN